MTNHTLQKSMFQSGCIFAGTAVVLGAFGAHALKEVLEPTELATFETGVKYQFMHALSILLIALSLRKIKGKTARYVWYLFSFGILFFSLSLYLLSMRSLLGLSDTFKAMGAITPIGGLCFIAGWFYLAYNGFRVYEEEAQHRTKRKSQRHMQPAENITESGV